MTSKIISSTTSSTSRSSRSRGGGPIGGAAGFSTGLILSGSGGGVRGPRSSQSVILRPTQSVSSARISRGSVLGSSRYGGGGGSSFSRISVGAAGLGSMGYRGYGGGMSQGLIQRTAALDLSTPLPQIDTTQRAIRVEESKQLQGLNNQFADFVGKVRYLERINTELNIKLKLLQDQGEYKSNIESMFQVYIDNLKKQLEALGQEKLRFEADLVQMQALVEDYKCKYEDEINKRTEMENEFVLVKKDVDDSYMSKVELEAKLEGLTDEIDFLRSIYEEEIRELQAQIQNTCVNVQLEGGPKFDVEELLANARRQYEACAQQSREEAETWKQTKMQELAMASGQCGDDLNMLKSEIKQSTDQIRKLKASIDALKKERLKLEDAIREAEERGENSLKDSRMRISELEEAILRAGQELSKQAREYEQLVGIKLALDIEIGTYKKMLEGEEARMASGVKTLNIQQVQSQADFSSFNSMSSGLTPFLNASAYETSVMSSSTRSPLLVKKTELVDGVTISSSINPLN
ncbi:keratin, type II cytoskeletal 8-like [Stegostoma tigrinum]|uniref:keratin, type II cytoskeletal 8-like n=1 Tax=Stegostoma tigrinum TaxID=3053191 RepID=UPI0028700FBC|nr:keratin, type II cytoskeletal 8-like [Stegostoma tigrinum]